MSSNPYTLEYYLSLKYKMMVEPTGDEGDFAYKVYANELDQDAFYGLGADPEDAIESFNEVRTELMSYYFENDIPIPEPESAKESLPSGKFLTRTTPYIHQKLTKLALRNEISLNAMVNQILIEYTTAEALVDRFSVEVKESVCAQLKKIESSWEQHLQWTTHRPHTVSKRKQYERAA